MSRHPLRQSAKYTIFANAAEEAVKNRNKTIKPL